ncbi:MAG: OmpA family protein [Spirochaetia bacterium]|nr:OmpA family protein [Spirochaetia bacterium]
MRINFFQKTFFIFFLLFLFFNKSINANEQNKLLGTINFLNNSFSLSHEEIKKIAEIARELEIDNDFFINQNKVIEITGYADSSSLNDYNFKLAIQRAQKIKETFNKLSVPENKIIINTFKENLLETDKRYFTKTIIKLIIDTTNIKKRDYALEKIAVKEESAKLKSKNNSISGYKSIIWFSFFLIITSAFSLYIYTLYSKT